MSGSQGALGWQDIQLAWMVALARVTLQRYVKLHVRTMLFYTHVVHFFSVHICESSSTALYFTDAGSLSQSLELSDQLL